MRGGRAQPERLKLFSHHGLLTSDEAGLTTQLRCARIERTPRQTVARPVYFTDIACQVCSCSSCIMIFLETFAVRRRHHV